MSDYSESLESEQTVKDYSEAISKHLAILLTAPKNEVELGLSKLAKVLAKMVLRCRRLCKKGTVTGKLKKKTKKLKELYKLTLRDDTSSILMKVTASTQEAVRPQ